MKIILIDPPGVQQGFNTGLGYLAGVLKKNGHNVKVIDLNNIQEDAHSRLLETKNCDVVGISIKSATAESGAKIGKEVKKINEKALLIAGGPHIAIDGYNFMSKNPFFDIAVRGEGENVILDILNGKKAIEGTITRHNKKIITNGGIVRSVDVDSLPYPAYECFDSLGKFDDYPLITSRGCPYSCSYCSVPEIVGKRWRFRSAEDVISELEYAKKTYGVKRFQILDDNFTLEMGRAKKFCRLLIDSKLNFEWSCPNGLRADRLDAELIELMKKSGCRFVSIGVESLAKPVFERINKKEKLEDITKAINLLKKVGIRVNGFFIIGLPGSTYKLDMYSLKQSKKLNLDSALWGIFVPYPGTPAWVEILKGKDTRMLRDWQDSFHFKTNARCTFDTKDYSEKQRIKMYYLANLRSNNYLGLVESNIPFHMQILKILEIILRYDVLNLPIHLLKMIFLSRFLIRGIR